jgi:hypothetical protein
MVNVLFAISKSIKLGKDDNSILKLLAGRTVRGNVIIAMGGEGACHRKFGNSKPAYEKQDFICDLAKEVTLFGNIRYTQQLGLPYLVKMEMTQNPTKLIKYERL